jgi:hypothetical protein
MRLHERLKYHLFLTLLSNQSQRELKAQYTQWQWEGYSHVVNIQMILLCVVFFIICMVPEIFRTPLTTSIHCLSGISPDLYAHYEQRYLRPWDPAYLPVRLLIRFCPILIPESKRKAAINCYKIWQKKALESPSSALNGILNNFEARNVNPDWLINVQNIIEFTIWHHGRIEKPFHLRAHGQWALKDFPDPKCRDPTRYALAASIMEQLVDVFNWRIQLGIRRDCVQTGRETRVGKRWDMDYPPPTLERAPDWVKHVAPAPEPMAIMNSCAREGLSFSEVLARHNAKSAFPQTKFHCGQKFLAVCLIMHVAGERAYVC